MVKVIQLSRANNVSIMLTTFGEVKPADLRKMLLTGRGLTLDKLSILLQVWWHCSTGIGVRHEIEEELVRMICCQLHF